MALISCALVLIATSLFSLAMSSTTRADFSGDFEITNLIIDSPFQRNPQSTSNSSISFDFCDQDRPSEIHCHIEWKVGLQPPALGSSSVCDDPSLHVWFPIGTYNGTSNLMLSLSHQYQDNSIGVYPFNFLTKFSDLNLTYPDVPDFGCDLKKAHCELREGSIIIAKVTRAIG